MQHQHDPLIGLDGLIKCRTCGELLPYFEEEICKVSSESRAKRVLEEIAAAGRYTVTSITGGFVIFSRETWPSNIIEEITCEKTHSRVYRIYKKLTSVKEV